MFSSGLYPNVAKMKIIRPGGRQINYNKPLKICTAYERSVSLHPKCVCDKVRDYTTPWLVFKEKLKLSQVCLLL